MLRGLGSRGSAARIVRSWARRLRFGGLPLSGLQCRGSFRPVNAYRYARCRRSDPGGRGSVSLALRIPRMASFLSVTWACDGDSNAGGASHEGPVLRILKEWGRRSWRVLTNVCFDSRPGFPPHVELRASASAPEAKFNPGVEYKKTLSNHSSFPGPGGGRDAI